MGTYVHTCPGRTCTNLRSGIFRAERHSQSPLSRVLSSWPGTDRAEVGRLLNCDPNEIALCESTTAGLNIFLWGLDFEPGDEIVAGSLENPTAIVPLRVLGQRRKVKVVYADQGNGDKDTTQTIQESITPRTKLVLISHVNYANGNRVDLKEISKLAHARNALLVADGIQPWEREILT